MPRFWNPDTNSFVDIYDDAASAIGLPTSDQFAQAAQPAEPPPPPADETPLALDPSFSDSATLAPPQVEAPPPVTQADVVSPPAVGGSSEVARSTKVRYNPYQPVVPDVGPEMASIRDAGVGSANALGRAEAALEANETERARITAERSKEAVRLAGERERKADERDALLAQKETEIMAARAAVPQADAKRVFKNMAGWEKGLLVIAGALNGWNVRFNGGKNPIVDTLMQIAEQDMRAQQMNIETAREDVFRTERAYGRDAARWDTKMDEFDLGVVQRLQAFDNDLASREANTQSEINRARIGQERFGIQSKIAEIGMNYKMRFAESINDFNKTRMVQLEESARQKASIEAQKDLKAMDKGKGPELANMFDGRAFGVQFERNTVPGSEKHVIDVGDSKVAQEINDAARKGTTVIQSVNRVLSTFEDGRKLPGNQSRELAKREVAHIMANYVLAEGRGLSDSDFKALQTALGDADPNRIIRLVSDETFRKKLIGFREGVKANTENSINRYESVFGRAKFNPKNTPLLIDPPDKRLDQAQALKALQGELAKDKPDLAKVAGYFDSFGDLQAEAALSLGRLAPSKTLETLDAARLRALDAAKDDPEMFEIISDTANAAMGKVTAEGVQGYGNHVKRVIEGTKDYEGPLPTF